VKRATRATLRIATPTTGVGAKYSPAHPSFVNTAEGKQVTVLNKLSYRQLLNELKHNVGFSPALAMTQITMAAGLVGTG